MGHIRQVRKRQIVLYQGEATSATYVIKEGVVRAYAVLGNGSESIIALYGPGDAFPVSFDPARANVSLFFYETMVDSVIESKFGDESVLQAQDNYADARRYVGALLHITALVQTSAHEKLLHILRYLGLRFGVEAPGRGYVKVPLKLTQQDIAELCGLSRETTNVELSRLKEKNIVIVRNKLYSINLRLVQQMIGDELDVKL